MPPPACAAPGSSSPPIATSDAAATAAAFELLRLPRALLFSETAIQVPSVSL